MGSPKYNMWVLASLPAVPPPPTSSPGVAKGYLPTSTALEITCTAIALTLASLIASPLPPTGVSSEASAGKLYVPVGGDCPCSDTYASSGQTFP